MRPLAALSTLSFVLPSLAVTISEINGDQYISPYKDKSVFDVEGLVTAKGPKGFFIRDTDPDGNDATSDSIYVYGSSSVSKVEVGDIITVSGKVEEYRSSSSYLYLTEISSPFSITVHCSGNEVDPIIIGEDRAPPTEEFSGLDNGDVLGVPNDVHKISVENPVLQPERYAMDFWESLSGELVSLTGLRAITKPNKYGDVFVMGDWASTGGNERGGLTMRANDSNPEAIKIGTPLDGTKNPTDTKLGDTLEDVVGVVQYAFGVYSVLPLTAVKVTGSNSTKPAPATIVSDGTCSGITIGDYNVENLAPDSPWIEDIADHIANYLNGPTIMCLQEIQDNNGPTDDGVVSANVTLQTLTDLISAHGGPDYAFTDIDPLNKKDGGQPGGNIRNAYLYDPSIVRLRNANPGSSTDANEVLPGAELKYNPGLIDPTNEAWTSSRKPLVAAWETVDGANKFFTVNVHFTSKGGGTSVQGDARPPVNGGVEKREAQGELVADFISDILAEDPNAKVLATGDFNEFTFVQPLVNFLEKSQLVELDEVVGIPDTERYTYIYDSNCQQLDHMFVSKALAEGAQMEHVHVNTWVSYDDAASDHDPTVARLNVC